MFLGTEETQLLISGPVTFVNIDSAPGYDPTYDFLGNKGESMRD
jgi:hypothetical protein